MDTYAHTQDKPRIELAEKIEANFYKQDISGPSPSGPEETKKPEATNITGSVILEAIRQMNPDERRGSLSGCCSPKNFLFVHGKAGCAEDARDAPNFG